MLDSIVSSASQEYVFLDKNEAAKLIGYAPDTLKKFRNKGLFQERIHWVRINSRSIRYNKSLLLDWLVNRDDPAAHERAIAAYLLSLPGNQRKTKYRSKRFSEPEVT